MIFLPWSLLRRIQNKPLSKIYLVSDSGLKSHYEKSKTKLRGEIIAWQITSGNLQPSLELSLNMQHVETATCRNQALNIEDRAFSWGKRMTKLDLLRLQNSKCNYCSPATEEFCLWASGYKTGRSHEMWYRRINQRYRNWDFSYQ